MEVVVPSRFCGYCGSDLRTQSGGQGNPTRAYGEASAPGFLQMVVGSELDRQFPLQGVMYVGREVDNDIQVNDPRISRRHARLRTDGSRVTVADLGSTNGTLVNDVPISGEYVLHDGDLIRMGHSEWAFHLAYSSGSAPRVQSRQPAADHEPAYAPHGARPAVRMQPKDIVDGDDLPWSAIAIVVGGLIIGVSICCIAAVFILSR